MAESDLTTKEQIESIWKLGGLTSRELGKRVWKVIYDGNLTGRASELAYNFIFSIFPLLIIPVSPVRIVCKPRYTTSDASDVLLVDRFTFRRISSCSANSRRSDSQHEWRKTYLWGSTHGLGGIRWDDINDLHLERCLSGQGGSALVESAFACGGVDHVYFNPNFLGFAIGAFRRFHGDLAGKCHASGQRGRGGWQNVGLAFERRGVVLLLYAVVSPNTTALYLRS